MDYVLAVGLGLGFKHPIVHRFAVHTARFAGLTTRCADHSMILKSFGGQRSVWSPCQGHVDSEAVDQQISFKDSTTLPDTSVLRLTSPVLSLLKNPIKPKGTLFV